MSERKWTESQLHAIESRDGSVLVSAAAGSGKTAVLVERIMQIVTDEKLGVDADRFLAVTFTNAAAHNIAAQLRAELAKRISDNPDDRRLKRQNLLLKRASISTIHAFCASLLREYFSLLDIPFDFTICDTLTASALSDDAIEAVLGELYADDTSGIKALSELFGRARSDKATAELILKLYEFESNLAFYEQWENDCLTELSTSRTIAETKAGKMLFSYAKDALLAAKSFTLEALSLCADDPDFDGAAAALTDDLDLINRMAALTDAANWQGVSDTLNALSYSRLVTKKGADENVKEKIKKLRERVKKIIEQLGSSVFVSSEKDFDEDRGTTLSAIKTLFLAVGKYREALFAEKLRRRSFEFSDIERLSLRLLCGENGERTAVCDEIAARFDYILVDEYQDTNEIQDLIFKLVSRDEKNLFFVGDVKQSIYSFRRADPEIFVARRERCYPDDAGLYPKKIDLSNNFRSSRAVIEAVNAVFSPIMKRLSGGTDYGDGEKLVPFDGSPNDDQKGLELHLLTKNSGFSEAEYLAAKIDELIKSGYPVRDKSGLRPCRAGDFCILLRSVKGKAEGYKKALEERGVRVWSDTSDNFFASSEIAVALALLRIIDNPRRSLELCSVMLSPLFGFTEDELLALRKGDKNAPFYTLVLKSRDPRCVNFVRVLSELRSFARTNSLAETVRFALDKTAAEVLLCAGGEFRSRRNNLRRLVEYANGFRRGEGAALPQFLAVCERAAKAKKSPDVGAFSPPNDAVSIISVHKSKGLEWPIVILADTAKGFNLQDASDSPLLFSASLGAGLKIKCELDDGISFISKKTAGYSALSLESRLNTKNEEMRVLYVALTRAKQKLIVVGEVSDPMGAVENAALACGNGEALPYTVNSFNCFLDWILSGLLLSCRGEFMRALGGESLPESFLSVHLAEALPEKKHEEETTTETAADEETLRELEQRLTFKYKNAELSKIPTKLSVSELSHKGGAILFKPSFAKSDLSGAEKGTAIHLFMQLADYKNAALSAKDELKRLTDGEYIDEALAKSINAEKLERLFSGELGKRIAAADVCLREYAFIDAVNASSVFPLSGEGDGTVLIQGIADCILIEKDGAVLIDYKSDRVKDEAELTARYGEQLRLYEAALNKRLGAQIKEILIYSFELNRTIRLK